MRLFKVLFGSNALARPREWWYSLLVISSGGNSSCIPRLTRSQAHWFSIGFEEASWFPGLGSWLKSGNVSNLMLLLLLSGDVRSGNIGCVENRFGFIEVDGVD